MAALGSLFNAEAHSICTTAVLLLVFLQTLNETLCRLFSSETPSSCRNGKQWTGKQISIFKRETWE